MGDKSSKETSQRQTVWRQGGNAIKVQMESLVSDLSKITKAERMEEIVLIHAWLSCIKTLLDTNSYSDRVFYLSRDKITIFTGSKHVLEYLKMGGFNFFF
jgi:hypothetical protein